MIKERVSLKVKPVPEPPRRSSRSFINPLNIASVNKNFITIKFIKGGKLKNDKFINTFKSLIIRFN